MPLLTSTERVGTVVGGRYRVLSVLGRGGMAVVFEAERVPDGLRVALKLPRAELTDGTRAERLAKEGGVTARVRHPHVVEVLEAGRSEDGLPFLALERLQGEDLGARLQGQGVLSPEEALGLLLPIAGALSVAHRAGVVHRDLKPSNIFLHREAGRVVPKLLDFGLARLAEADRLTRSGTAVGTPDYMPPEQAAAEGAITSATDVWSLSAVLWCCVTGRPPRWDSGALVCQGFERWPSLALALERGLRREPARRFGSMQAWAEAVVVAARADGIGVPEDPDPVGLPGYSRWRRAQASDSTLSQEVTVARDRARYVWWRPFALALSLSAGLGLFALRGQPAPPAPSAEAEQSLPGLASGAVPRDLTGMLDGQNGAEAVWQAEPASSAGVVTVPEPGPAPAEVGSGAPASKGAAPKRWRPRISHVLIGEMPPGTPDPLEPTSEPTDAGMSSGPLLQREFGSLPSLKTQW